MSFQLNKPQEPQKSIFGNPLNAQPAQNPFNPLNPTSQPSATGTAKPGTSIFGNIQSTGGTNLNSTTSSSGAGLFGAGSSNPATSAPTSMTPAGGSIFGAGSGATSTNTAGTTPSLFSNVPKPPENPTAGSIFGGGSNSGATPATNSIFGNIGTGATTPAGGSIFGGGTGSNPLVPGKNADTNASKPSIFGITTSGAPTSTTTSSNPTSGTGLFNLPPKPAESTSAATPGLTTQPAPGAPSTSTGNTGTTGAAPGASLFNTANLFGKTSVPATSTTPASSTAGPASTIFPIKPEEKKDGAATTSITTPGLNLFGAPQKAGPTTPVATSTALGTKPATTAPAASVAVPPPSMLRGKTLEEIVNRWSSDLETHAREFNRFAAEVAVWDRALIENGNNLSALYSHIQAAERQQDSIDQSLTHIEQQQKDLSATLDSYEKLSQELLGGQGGSLRTLDTGPADTERDKNYILATDLHTQLDDLSGSLTQMIDAVNALSVSSKPNGDLNDDPMTQIFQILSSHLESLQWIDGAVREVEGKVGDIERRVKDSGYNLSGSTSQSKSRAFGLGR